MLFSLTVIGSPTMREREGGAEGKEIMAYTCLLLGLLLEFSAVIEFDKQEGLEFGLVSI